MLEVTFSSGKLQAFLLSNLHLTVFFLPSLHLIVSSETKPAHIEHNRVLIHDITKRWLILIRLIHSVWITIAKE